MALDLFDTIFGVTSLLCFLLGTTGNILAVSYFLTRRTSMSPNTLLYICINLTDILICNLTLFTGLVNLSPALGDSLFLNSPVFCNLWGVLWNMTIRVSVFLIAVLSVSRVVSIHDPHRRLSRWSVAVPVMVYVGLMLLQASIPFIRGSKYEYFSHLKVCSWDLSKVFGMGSPPFNVLYFLLNIVEFVMPIFPVTTCCCFIIMKLRSRSTDSLASCARVNALKREATITIVLLTITYLVWNLPLCVVLILNYVTQISELHHHGSPDHYHFEYHVHLRTFMNSQTIVLNSVCNTCLYFYRITDLRRWTVDLIEKFFTRMLRFRTARVAGLLPNREGEHFGSCIRPSKEMSEDIL